MERGLFVKWPRAHSLYEMVVQPSVDRSSIQRESISMYPKGGELYLERLKPVEKQVEDRLHSNAQIDVII